MRYFGRVAGAAAGLLVLLGASSAPAWANGGHQHQPPKRVLILVLDQFRPDYVDSSTCERQGADARRRELRERVSRPHGLRDGDQPQRDHQRAAPARHGLVGRGLPRQRQRARRGRRLDVDLGVAHARPVQPADRPRRLSQARRLPARAPSGHEVHRRRPEELRRLLVERPDRRHLADVLEPQLRLRRRRRQQLARADRVQRARPTCRAPECGRFYVDSSTSTCPYGTATTPPAWMYPLDGNRFAPASTRRTAAATSGPPTPAWR